MASRPAVRGLFAPGNGGRGCGGAGLVRRAQRPTSTSSSPFSGHPGLDVGVNVATATAAESVAGLGTEASIWSGTRAAVTGPDVEPDIVPSADSGVQVVAAADRSRAFTPSPPAGLVAGA